MAERAGERRGMCEDAPLLGPPHEPLGTSNIQHPTSNTQPPINGPIGNHWLFDVGCWVLDVFLRFMGSMRDIFGEFSPRDEGVGRGPRRGANKNPWDERASSPRPSPPPA